MFNAPGRAHHKKRKLNKFSASFFVLATCDSAFTVGINQQPCWLLFLKTNAGYAFGGVPSACATTASI